MNRPGSYFDPGVQVSTIFLRVKRQLEGGAHNKPHNKQKIPGIAPGTPQDKK
jgi:hypothetical protein